MKYARIINSDGSYLEANDIYSATGGKIIQEITADIYAWAVDNEKSIGVPVCKCCGCTAALPSEEEIAEGRPADEFYHKPDAACLQSLVDDAKLDSFPGEDRLNSLEKATVVALRKRTAKLLEEFLNTHDFDPGEIWRNKLELKKWEEINDEKIEFLMSKLTGKEKLSEWDRKAVEDARERLNPMVGLADRPWALPYFVAIVVGSCLKGKYRYTFKLRGDVEDVRVKDVRGRDRKLKLPSEIALYFVNRKDDNVVTNPFNGKEVAYKVEPPTQDGVPLRPGATFQSTLTDSHPLKA